MIGPWHWMSKRLEHDVQVGLGTVPTPNGLARRAAKGKPHAFDAATIPGRAIGDTLHHSAVFSRDSRALKEAVLSCDTH
jgi:hypothetical protein